MTTHVVAQFAQSKLFISFIFLFMNFRYIVSYKNFKVPTEKDLF